MPDLGKFWTPTCQLVSGQTFINWVLFIPLTDNITRFFALQAYQVLRKGGLSDDRIVVMVADDLAENYMNPHPGKVFNRPGGEDVYKGVPLVPPHASYTLAYVVHFVPTSACYKKYDTGGPLPF